METKDDPLGRLAILRVAANLAADGGDLSTAAAAIDEQARSHDVDAPQRKLEAAEAASKGVRFPQQHEKFCHELLPVIRASIAADRYTGARRMVELLGHSAKVARKPQLVTGAAGLAADIEELAAEYEKVKQPLASHQAGTATPADKLNVGMFLCFLKGDWKVGLPLLAAGGEGPVSQLAVDELAGPTQPTDQLQLADGWWSQADESEGLRAKRLRQHATQWYQKALPQLTGLSAAKAKRNIEIAAAKDALSVEPSSGEELPPSRPLALIDLLALSSDAALSRQAVGGEWSRSKDGVVSGDSAYVRLSLPYRVKKSYELEVEFKILGGKDESVCLILPVGDRQTVLCIDGWVAKGGLTYLCNVQGREAVNNPSAVRGKQLKRGQLHNAHLDVSWDDADDSAQVIFTLDGRHVFTWTGRTNDLSVQAGWEMPRSQEIGLATYVTSAEFSKATLIEK